MRSAAEQMELDAGEESPACLECGEYAADTGSERCASCRAEDAPACGSSAGAGVRFDDIEFGGMTGSRLRDF